MHVTLIGYSDNCCIPAIEVCHNNKFNGDKREKILREVIRSGHLSILEFVDFTFEISDVSRSLTHQLVRHRIASYAQQSQRHVTSDMGFHIPQSIYHNETYHDKYVRLLNDIGNLYFEMMDKGIPREDARYILPNATHTKIIVKMNARSLIQFFNLRCCSHAQFEIRLLANEMLAICRDKEPIIFEGNFPDCPDCKHPCNNRIITK